MALQQDQLLALMAAVLASGGAYDDMAQRENVSESMATDYFVDVAADLLKSAEDKYSGRRG